jgi:hypothetical protein
MPRSPPPRGARTTVDLRSSSAAGPSPLAAPARPRTDVLAWFGGLSLVLSLVAIAWFFVVLVRDVEAADFTHLETGSARLDVGPGWFDPRWEQELAQRLALLPALDADSVEARACIEDALAEFPFVAEIGATHVIWPDGVQVDVRLRQPVACVRTGDLYVCVAEDAVVLPGAWSLPPARGHGFVPLIALSDGGRDEVLESIVLTDAATLDALAVATQMWAQLGDDDWLRLGRFVIDARHARIATVQDPGVVLWLESGRRVYLGRSPNLDAPGELPFASKCASLSRSLRVFDAGSEAPLDWELADVRWDRPELLPRGGIDDPERGRGAR